MNGAKIKLLIVDDHPLFRQGVRLFLETIRIWIAGEAGCGGLFLSWRKGLTLSCWISKCPGGRD